LVWTENWNTVLIDVGAISFDFQVAGAIIGMLDGGDDVLVFGAIFFFISCDFNHFIFSELGSSGVSLLRGVTPLLDACTVERKIRL